MNVSLISDKEPYSAAVTGQVIQRNVSPFSDPIEELLGPDVFSRPLLLDMSGVEMFDSSGVSWLLRCHKRFRQSNGKLIVHSVSPTVQDVIRLLKIDQVLTIAGSSEEAVQMLNENPA